MKQLQDQCNAEYPAYAKECVDQDRRIENFRQERS